MNTSFRDCYIEFTDNRLKIGNQKVERIIEIKNGLPVSISFGKECNKWQGGNISMFNVADFDFKMPIYHLIPIFPVLAENPKKH